MPLRIISSDNTERSHPHRRVESWLNERYISYMSEEPFPPYRVDIYLPEWRLAIEVDGPYHSAKHDEKRDAFLQERYGLLVLRLSYQIKKEAGMASIIEFIEANAESADIRKTKWHQTAH